MTASEKLRVLQASPAYKVREDLERVLPQLRAVVEAAEEMLRCFDRTGEEVGGYSLRACLDSRAALAALEEALS